MKSLSTAVVHLNFFCYLQAKGGVAISQRLPALSGFTVNGAHRDSESSKANQSFFHFFQVNAINRTDVT